MLTRLYINNFITIELIDIEFPPGFITLTGETGAGKSIILDALNLLCGNRLDSSKLNTKENKIIIEADFNVSKFDFFNFFDAYGIDYSDSTIIRREILPNGKSRSFINDTPVKLELLKIISGKLLDIHSQHESLLLNNEFFQLDFIDNILINQDKDFLSVLKKYRKDFMINKKLSEELEELVIKNQLTTEENVKNLLLIDEFCDLDLKKGEKQNLLDEYNLLKNSNHIKLELEQTLNSLDFQEQSVISILNIVSSSLQKIEHYSKKISEFSSRINSNLIDLQDVVREINIFHDRLYVDQNRLRFVEERLNTINLLEEKHLVSTFDQLLDKRNILSQKQSEFSDIENKIKTLKTEYNNHSVELFSQAKLLSKKRNDFSKKIEFSLISDLKSLGINSANIEFKFNTLEKYNYYGIDSVDFLFSANKGHSLKPIKNVASGGELSRLMLSIKKHLFSNSNLSTIIFDEVDAGVSGEIAEKVGVMMKKISKKQQIITITHLPQVSSLSDSHYKVLKDEKSQKSNTKIISLNKEERVLEIARLLSGEKILPEAIANAKKMLEM